MSNLRERLLTAFQAEHREYLEGIRALVAQWEKAGGILTAPELDEGFRLAHSLKAAARACDFPTVEALGQRLETFFGHLRKGTRPGKPVVEGVKAVLNAIEDWAIGLTAQSNPSEPTEVLAAFDRLLGSGPKAQTHPAEANDLTAKLLAAFQIEHKEHLESIRSLLASLEPGSRPSAGQVDEVFRRAHSLKGAARLAGLRPAELLAHRLESLFARVREGMMGLNPEILRAVHLALDAIEDGAACLAENRAPPDPTPILAALERALAAPEQGEEMALVPPVANAPGSPDAGGSPASPRRAGSGSDRKEAAETVRVSAANLDRLLRSTEQLLTEALRQDLVRRQLTDLGGQVSALEKEWELVRNSAAASLRRLAAAPEFARVARYVGFVERQVRSLVRRSRELRLLQQRSAQSLRLLSGQLQQDVHRVQLVTADSVYQGFRKMVRDQAREEGKEIEFRVTGLEVQADRMVLQTLKDPLMHMLCNAVSHGIESPHERANKGKSEVGQVALHLEIVGNRLRIQVEDDGQGIDLPTVAEVAVSRGLLTSEQAANESPAELARLIFRPGFSTSEAVTDLSGRGMGLSVVQEAVTRLQGEVDLLDKEGPGTCLLLSVPLTVSTQRLLLVSCGGQTFAVPVHAVERLVRAKAQDVEQVEGKPMLLVQGQPIPVQNLAQLLNLGVAEPDEVGPTRALMVLRSGGRRLAVAVDAFLAERDSVIKNLEGPAARVALLAGGILLEDGAVALVLNARELLRTYTTGAPPLARVSAPAPKKIRTASVLVVDDSLTTRTLEKSILEAHGYEVRIAMDGLEALARLRAEPTDLVITDVQMPHLDGFGLLVEMKKDPRLARIPVIVVTSMARREDQERGLALGANAYIVKKKFDHQDLLDTIRQLV